MTSRMVGASTLIRVAFLALAFALGSTAMASAQAPSMEDLGTRLNPETAAAVRTLIESAASEGIPHTPLVTKALEGQSKGASSDRIILAVRTLATDLAAARLALGTAASSSEIVAGAGALRSGAPPAALSRLKAARNSQSVLLPLATLTDLVARGVPVDAAVKTVLALAERGASEADYRAQAGANGRPGEGGAVGAPASGAPAPTIPRPPTGVTGPGTPPPAERPTSLPR
jgi:hypothetical protein